MININNLSDIAVSVIEIKSAEVEASLIRARRNINEKGFKAKPGLFDTSFKGV